MAKTHFDSVTEQRQQPPPDLRWMYLLVATPMLTDVIETGGRPTSPREWVTELVVGLLLAMLVRHVLKQQRQLHASARCDPLTNLLNRRDFDESVKDECARARRSTMPLTLVYFDLDNFKAVNDSAGHGAGDRVLRQFADAIRHAVRDRVDRGFRIGGDEFAVLLPGSTSAQAESVVDRIRSHCSRTDTAWVDGALGLSAGIAVFDVRETGADFIRRADEAMYQAKQAKGAREA